ncbi:hypothetical protein [Kribbella sp. NPDC055071]
MQRQARLFRLVRHTDTSAGSDRSAATGILAEGVEWSDGAVALRWRGPWPSTSTWDGGIESVLAVHGTGGRTRIHWLPSAPAVPGKTPPPAESLETVWLPAPGVDGRCSRCGRPWPCLSCGP